MPIPDRVVARPVIGGGVRWAGRGPGLPGRRSGVVVRKLRIAWRCAGHKASEANRWCLFRHEKERSFWCISCFRVSFRLSNDGFDTFLKLYFIYNIKFFPYPENSFFYLSTSKTVYLPRKILYVSLENLVPRKKILCSPKKSFKRFVKYFIWSEKSFIYHPV